MFAIRVGQSAAQDWLGSCSINGQGAAYFAFGDTSGNNSALQGYNRKLTFSNLTESANTAFSPGFVKIPQGFATYSNANSYFYIFFGYNGGLDTNIQKSSMTTNTQTTAANTIAGTKRRGGMTPGVCYGIRTDTGYGSVGLVGGYSDALGAYVNEVSGIYTYNDTLGGAGAFLYTCHVGAAFQGYLYSYYVSGINASGNLNNIGRRDVYTGTLSNLAATDVQGGYYCCGVCMWGYGYRFAGTPQGNANNLRMNMYNETAQTGPALVGSTTIFAVSCSASISAAYIWTAYQNTLNRFLNVVLLPTETVTNNSYSTGDASSGWINATGVC